MGMAASQARLLSLTARIHDVEYQAQQIQSRKLQLATLEDEAYQKYNDALDATTLTFTNDAGTVIPANFENLCGKASIENGLHKNYVFRAGDNDKVIIPDDIYEGYKNFGKSDPYEFAMYMMGADIQKVEDAEQTFITGKIEDGLSTRLQELQTTMKSKASELAKAVGLDEKTVVDGLTYDMDDLERYGDKDASNYEEVKKIKQEYQEIAKEFRYKMYQNGASTIYKTATEEENFNQSEFDYYLRWGMIINQEIGLEGCIKESDYGEDFGANSELLNQMLQSGRILVDTVEFDKKGGIKDSTTSVAADSNLAFTPTSTIDKKALAKAEAEYEHTMKELDRKDKRFDMDLNKLETERTALTTEYDSVKKVIQENVERTFGIFS